MSRKIIIKKIPKKLFSGEYIQAKETFDSKTTKNTLPLVLKNNDILEISKYHLYRRGYCTIQQGKYHNEPVALKIYDLDDDSEKVILQKAQLEASFLERLQKSENKYSKYIITYHGYIKSPDQITLVMELANNNTLFSIISDPNYSQTKTWENWGVRIAIQILKGFSLIHSLGMIHCDAKPANIAIHNANGKDYVKVIDFGDAQIENKEKNSNSVGTMYYAAPEVLRKNEPRSAKTDLFSLAIIINQLRTGTLLNSLIGAYYVLNFGKILSNGQHCENISTQFTPKVKSYLQQCLNTHSMLRPELAKGISLLKEEKKTISTLRN